MTMPHFLKRIDSVCRHTEQSKQIKLQEEVICLAEDAVLLDPLGNAPLKLHAARAGDISKFAQQGWSPPLLLSAKQREIFHVQGSVLLLGRSGTGKTECLCDCMMKDREASGGALRQLFVSRSARLMEKVKAYQAKSADAALAAENCDFLTLEELVQHMQRVIGRSSVGGSCLQFYLSRRVDFPRFQQLMKGKLRNLDAVVAWTQIRSFIKGSVESVLKKGALSIEEYLDPKEFGEERCRLSKEQRIAAYSVYEQYAHVLKSEGLWDDADRVLNMLAASKLEPLCDSNGKGFDYDRVYVDEVQDSTQAEIVLYLLAAGMNVNALFLAGDPAQSVVEGVDFRFEEVRSIVHQLSEGKARIERPVKLTVNYRSHAGILNVAGAVLLAMFPGAAKVLPKDEGLFQGPRPAFTGAELSEVLRSNERLVVLCRDERAAAVEEQMHAKAISNIVIGIRAAKGLEFQDVLLYDFFGAVMEEAVVKGWKELFTAKEEHTYVPYRYPALESQLKLLYTAMTRSCNRLVFAEPSASKTVSQFFAWLQSINAAEPLRMEVDVQLMTSDEWRAQGIEFALAAEGEATEAMLSKALHCFAMAGDDELKERGAVQLKLHVLQRKWRDGGERKMSQAEEIEVSGIVARGLKAGLLEARSVLGMLQECVASPVYFSQELADLKF